jgi:predicted O-methyltransferase YrrM
MAVRMGTPEESTMDRAVEQVIAEFEKRENAENKLKSELPFEEGMSRRDEFLLSVGRATGQLLNILAREAKPRTILEVGTSYGYSTVWLADAARAIGAKVITLEIHPTKFQQARAALSRAGLADVVEFCLGDARESIPALPGPFDFVLLDLWKDLYVPCFELFYPKLSAGAFVLADNMLYPTVHRPKAARYRAHIRSKPHMESVLLPVGSGVELSRLAPDAL